MIFLRRREKLPDTPAHTLARVDARARLERQLVALTPLVRRWLFRMLGPRAALDDATQDALVALAEALPTLTDPTKEQAFARTVTLRVGYRYFRKRDVVLDTPEELASGAPGPEAALAERRALERLHRCLQRLPAKRRMAFVLCGIEGLSHAEAAELEDTSEASMRSRFMHARQELVRMLGHTRSEDGHD